MKLYHTQRTVSIGLIIFSQVYFNFIFKICNSPARFFAQAGSSGKANAPARKEYEKEAMHRTASFWASEGESFGIQLFKGRILAILIAQKNLLHSLKRPHDPDLRIVPKQPTLVVGMPEIGDLVAELGFV